MVLILGPFKLWVLLSLIEINAINKSDEKKIHIYKRQNTFISRPQSEKVAPVPQPGLNTFTSLNSGPDNSVPLTNDFTNTNPQITGLEISQFQTNQAGTLDTNRLGFNPFQPVKEPNPVGLKSLLAGFNIASVILPFYLFEPFGLAVSMGLMGVVILFQPTLHNPKQIYQSIFGSIQGQINQAANNKDVSILVSNLQTLSQNVNGKLISYVVFLTGSPATTSMKETINQLASGQIPLPVVAPKNVDIMMKTLDSILSVPNNWYSAIDSNDINQNFVLTDAIGIDPHFCFHTKDYNLADGTRLQIDGNCNLNSLDDKLWAVGANGQLILRTNYGPKCVAYDNGGSGAVSENIAIFDLNRSECKNAKRPIKLVRAKDNTWSLFDGTSMLCSASDGTLVTTQSYKKTGFLWIKHNKHHDCINGNALAFKTRIPVILNPAGQGGASGNSVTPPLTFQEIGVQIFYFNSFAGIHLLALKEIYLNGLSKPYAESQFNINRQKYLDWLNIFLPTFLMYAKFARINATKQIMDANQFRKTLAQTTLTFNPLTVQVP